MTTTTTGRHVFKPGRAEAWMPRRIAGETLDDIAKTEGLTRERVRQVLHARYGHTGPDRRNAPPDLSWLPAAETLRAAGVSDRRVALQLGVSEHAVRRYVQTPRRPLGVDARERALAALHHFVATYGRTPVATDWNPSHRRARGLEQYPVAYPHLTNIQRLFGSWREFLLAGGYPALRAGHRATDQNPMYDYPVPS